MVWKFTIKTFLKKNYNKNKCINKPSQGEIKKKERARRKSFRRIGRNEYPFSLNTYVNLPTKKVQHKHLPSSDPTNDG